MVLRCYRFTVVSLAFGRWRLLNKEFKASLKYMRPYLKKNIDMWQQGTSGWVARGCVLCSQGPGCVPDPGLSGPLW